MNVLNLEVKIKKIKIHTNDDSSICFSLRLGRILSGISNTIMNVNNKNNGQLDTNIQLSIACEQSILISNNRASLVVYEVHSNQTKDIIGMVFIILNNQQGQIQRYKIQQSTDPNSFIQLTFNIASLQVKQRQNQSLASKSSLAEIKQLHRVLTHGHKRSVSEYSYPQSQNKKARHSLNQRQKTKNTNKIQHLKSQQSPVIQSEEYQTNLKLTIKKYEQQLTKQRQRNSILINLLVVQEQKNTQSQNFIKNIVNTLQNIQNTKKQTSQNNNITNIKLQLKQTQKQKLLLKEQNQRQQNKKHHIKKQNEFHIQTLIKQRDQLYSISHELYEKTKKYKDQNEQLHNNIKIIENQLRIAVVNLQQLRNQNIQFKKQIFDLNYKKQIQGTDLITQLKEINEQNKNLKKENIENERKFKQSFRAIQQFKNDAWKAQEQIIMKDHIIQSLKQQLSQLKRQTQNLRQYQSPHQILLLENNNSQAQKLFQTSQAFRQMTQLIIKNNIERFNLLQNMNQKQKEFEAKPIKSEISTILSEIKQRIGQIYKQYEKQNKKSIPILEMRRKIIQIINSITF